MADTGLVMEPTIFSRLERLDVMMGYLEEIIRGNGRARRSSCASTTSSGTPTGSDGGGGIGGSSVGSSPRSLERRCRSMEEVMAETQLKGSLVERLHLLEDRVLKLSLQLEEEMGSERKKEEEKSLKAEKHHHKKGLKSLVRSCVRGKPKAPKESKD